MAHSKQVGPPVPTTRRPAPARAADTAASPGRPLDPQTAAQLSAAFGHDFGKVRVHTDERAAAAADALGAVAYTRGEDMVFARGRYAPGTPTGRQVLAHEAAHVVQQARWGPPRPGVAPPGAASERQADAAAVLLPQTTWPVGRDWLRSWAAPERPWEVQPQRVTTTGTPAVREPRVGMAPGTQGPAVGMVEVRTGEAVEVSPGTIISNLIALEYRGVRTADTHWLQFVWFEMTAVTPAGTVRFAASIPTTSGTLPFTTDPAAPVWAVDSGPDSPWYESGALAITTSQSRAMFDAPGGSSAAGLAAAVFAQVADASWVTFTAHFDTYLVQANRPMYHVPWAASTGFIQNPVGAGLITSAIVYTVGAAGNVTALPANLRTILHTSYPAFTAVK
jgi:uncharacterized protein DUF4157